MPYRDAGKARAYQRDYRRIRRTGDRCTTPCTSRIETSFRLQTAQDVIDLLQEQVALVRDDDGTNKIEKARCIGYLGSIALRAIEAGNIEARLEALESALQSREQRS
jgi:hypothetical protein